MKSAHPQSLRNKKPAQTFLTIKDFIDAQGWPDVIDVWRENKWIAVEIKSGIRVKIKDWSIIL